MKGLIMISLLCLLGCRTVKTTTKASDEMKRDVELNTVAVKAAQRETNTVTYWPDGQVYQLQNVKEQVDQTQLGRLGLKEKQVAKQLEVKKESEPLRIWVYVGVGAVVIATVLIYWKFKK